MCGIIGYTGASSAIDNVLSGLHALEYRGYDSAGIAYFDGNQQLCTLKSSGKICTVEGLVASMPPVNSHCAIGHTRWATHGEPSHRNAHPHGTDTVQIVHNGIIENAAELRAVLEGEGYTFSSETDTEAAAVLLDACYRQCGGEAVAAMAAMAERLRGAYAIAAVFADRPEEIYAIRRDNPLIVGCGEHENFVASDITALLSHTRRYYSLHVGEIACVRAEGVVFMHGDGSTFSKKIHTADWSLHAAERGGYPHFMSKEIHEEADAVLKTLTPRVKDMLPDFSGEQMEIRRLTEARRIYVVACGTALHAGLHAKFVMEKYARVPVSAEIASEFRYADPILDERDAVIVISQSGETADTLAALRLAKRRGAYTLAIINAVGSTIAREADATVYTWAGPEIAVASTKAYTVQTALMTLLGVHMALAHGTMDQGHARTVVEELLTALPTAINAVLAREEEIAALAKCVATAEHLFFIGRNVDYYAAQEASLKLKEISYIHSEAYAAGEMKHGTISLIDFGTPVIALSTTDSLREKLINNCKEVAARGAQIFTVCTADATEFDELSKGIFKLPPLHAALAPIAMATVLQLLAYHVSVLRGCDVDQPRNLAKSVTVE